MTVGSKISYAVSVTTSLKKGCKVFNSVLFILIDDSEVEKRHRLISRCSVASTYDGCKAVKCKKHFDFDCTYTTNRQ